jgi:hypothetical protein
MPRGGGGRILGIPELFTENYMFDAIGNETNLARIRSRLKAL